MKEVVELKITERKILWKCRVLPTFGSQQMVQCKIVVVVVGVFKYL